MAPYLCLDMSNLAIGREGWFSNIYVPAVITLQGLLHMAPLLHERGVKMLQHVDLSGNTLTDVGKLFFMSIAYFLVLLLFRQGV